MTAEAGGFIAHETTDHESIDYEKTSTQRTVAGQGNDDTKNTCLLCSPHKVAEERGKVERREALKMGPAGLYMLTNQWLSE